MSDVVIVDDRDPSIHYNGTWHITGVSVEYNSTTSWPGEEGASATFQFVGTAVTVYGSVDIGFGSLGFNLDNSTSASLTGQDVVKTVTHHVVLFASSALADGPHTLVISQTTDASPTIFLDYITYNASSQTNTNGLTFLVDDMDTRIQYKDGWSQVSNDDAMGQSYHASTASGASFSYSFDGTQVALYGPLNSTSSSSTNGSSIQTVVDSGVPVPLTVPNVNGSFPNTLIWSSGVLASGHHTLVVTTQNDHPFSFDYLLVTPNPEAGGASSSSLSSPSETSESTSVGGSKSNAGPIAGGVVGGLVLLVALGLLAWWYRKKSKSQSTTIEPFQSQFVTPRTTLIQPQTVRSPEPSTTFQPDRMVKQPDPLEGENSRSGLVTVTAADNSPLLSTSHALSSPTTGSVEDSGIRFPRDTSGATIPPPGYTFD